VAADRRLLRSAVEETADKIDQRYRYAAGRPEGERCGSRSSATSSVSLIDHKQPECAETFFNSVSVQGAEARLLQQPLHLRAAGDLDGAHRRRPAVLPQLLPAAAGIAATR
jgi:hypothetical protein